MEQRRPGELPAILFVSQARGLGGSTRSLATLLDGLRGRVHRVLASPQGKFVVYAGDNGLIDEHVALPDPGGSQSWRVSRPVAAARVVRRALAAKPPLHAIHANGPEEINIAAPAALVARVPLAVWIHAFEISPWVRRLAPMWRLMLRRHDVRWAAVSPTARRVLTGSGLTEEDRVAIVPNPIDAADILAPGRLESASVRIGYVGSAESRKGFHLLPEIIGGLGDVDVRWMLFTNERSRERDLQGDIWARLHAFGRERVAVVGKLEDARQVYASCDIVFCPSFKESFCRVAAEGMMNGIPVVASDIEPLRDLLGDAEAGLLFPPGDVDAAVQALRRLATDPALRRRLGSQGALRANAFAPDRVVAALAALYGVVESEPV